MYIYVYTLIYMYLIYYFNIYVFNNTGSNPAPFLPIYSYTFMKVSK